LKRKKAAVFDDSKEDAATETSDIEMCVIQLSDKDESVIDGNEEETEECSKSHKTPNMVVGTTAGAGVGATVAGISSPLSSQNPSRRTFRQKFLRRLKQGGFIRSVFVSYGRMMRFSILDIVIVCIVFDFRGR
jgi:hypothetical protein